ncbi:MAG: carboxypeptidase-like regulatory domain-containing protein [Myxococcales bacterium]|nr:carboxypeptidase-like regulatory domain-containing protein [Myxococcales bacterium]
MLRSLSWWVVAVLLSSSCIDLALPQASARGSLKGSIDTSAGRPMVSAVGHDVRLIDASGSVKTQTSGTGGAFVFGDLAPGIYVLEVKVAGFAPDIQVGLKVVGGEELEVGPRQLVWLGGTVAEATVSGRVATADSADPTGAQVGFLLQPMNTLVQLASIGSSGEFVSKVPPGVYRLRVTHSLYVTLLGAELTFTEAQVSQLANPLVLDVNPATVAGEVRRERSGLDGGFDPVVAAGVLVTVDPGGMTTSTGADGRFSLGGLSAGPKSVRFSLAGHHDPAPEHNVTLSPGVTATIPSVLLRLDRGDLVGTVELADRQPVLGVNVSLAGTNFSAAVVPDPIESWRGAFRISGVPTATGYEVVALKSGYSRAVRGGQTVVKDTVTNVGALTLTALRGDFVIDDGDSNNTAGFTRSPAVTLELQGFATMGAAQFRASESPSFPDAGFAPFVTPRQGFTLSAAQGTHTVFAQYVDGSGTQSPVFVASVVLDSVPPAMPSIVLADGDAFTANGVSVNARVTASEDTSPTVDAVSGLRETRVAESNMVDSMGRLPSVPAAYRRDFTHLRAAMGDGPFTLCAQVFDHAGNFTTPVCDDLVVDTARPVGSLTIRQGARATITGHTDIERVFIDGTATPEPNGGALRVRLANSVAGLGNAPPQAFTSPAVLQWDLDSAGADGLRTVVYQFEDLAGNFSAMPLTATVVLDRTPPTAGPLVIAPASPTRLSAVTVTVAASDSLSGLSPTAALTLSEDALFSGPGTLTPRAMPVGGTVPFSLSLPDGPKLLYGRFRDGAGNDTLVTLRVDLDTTPPSASVRLEGTLGDGSTSDTLTSTANITAVITALGATGVLTGDEGLTACPAGGYGALPGNGRLAVTLSGAASPRELRTCFIDGAGNTLGPIVNRITLDATPPTNCSVSISGARFDGTAAPAGQTARSTLAVTTTGCSDAPAEWVLTEGTPTCTAAGLPWVPFAAGAPFSLLGGDGAHTVRACVRDAARNPATALPATVTLDSTPPSGASLVLDTGAPFVNLSQFQARGNSFRVTAVGSAIDATEWSLSASGTFSTFQPFPATSSQNFTFPGTGTQRLFAVFRDALGNPSVVVFDDITLDISPPSIVGVTASLVTNAPDPVFIPTDAVGVRILPTPPADATRLFFVQVPPATACSGATVFTGAFARPVTGDLAFVASGGDGPKRLCLAFGDDALNQSEPVTLDFTVDTTPPGAPEISTAPVLNNLPDNAPFTVTLARPIVETNFLRTERLGGKVSTWTPTGSPQATVAFGFNLVSSATVESTTNVLQLRAVDRAGNIGPLSNVTVTTDVQLPAAPTTSTLGVSNLTQAASVFWARSSAPDVASYRVLYGPSSGQYDGAGASEGQSPITVSGTLTQFGLHGLVDGTPTYVRIAAVDLAGNVGPSSSEVVLQPNRVSPTLVAETIAPTAVGGLGRIVVQEDIALAVGPVESCVFVNSNGLTLVGLDLSGLRSATQTGQLELPLPSAPVLWTVPIAASLTNHECRELAYDLLVDGPWAFVVANSSVFIFKITSRLAAPTLYATVPLGFTGRTLTLQGSTLFANGLNVAAIDLAPLYDDNASTTPTVGAVVTNGLAGYDSAGFVVTRNRGIQVPLGANANSPHWNIVDAADGNPAGWDNADFLSFIGGSPLNPPIGETTHVPLVSGNYLYTYTQGQVVVRTVANLWTTAAGSAGLPVQSVLVNASLAAAGPLVVAGRDIVGSARDGTTLFHVDATDVTAGLSLTSEYQLDVAHRPKSIVAYGPYLAVSTNTGRAQFYELATPRALRVSATRSTGSIFAAEGSFLFGANGSVLDLQAGPVPTELVSQVANNNPLACAHDVVPVGEFLVRAPIGEGRLDVLDVSNATDRLGSTSVTYLPFTSGYTVPLSSVIGVHAIEAWGNFLVVLESRATGFYLEVFRATALRDLSSSTSLSSADSLGSIQLSALTPPLPSGQLALSNGRAFVTISNDNATALTNSVIVVDFRNLVDEVAATSGLVLQGTLPVTGARGIAVSGNRAFVTTLPTGSATLFDALEVWNVAAALDDAAGTVLSETAPIGRLALPSRPQNLKVYGGYAFVTNDLVGSNARTWSVDLANPALPRISSVAIAAPGVASCSGANLGSVQRGSIEVVGSRLYLGGSFSTVVLELE